MGSLTECVSKEATTVEEIGAIIVAGMVEATTVGLAPRTAAPAQPTAGLVTEATTVAGVGGTMSVT